MLRALLRWFFSLLLVLVLAASLAAQPRPGGGAPGGGMPGGGRPQPGGNPGPRPAPPNPGLPPNPGAPGQPARPGQQPWQAGQPGQPGNPHAGGPGNPNVPGQPQSPWSMRNPLAAPQQQPPGVVPVPQAPVVPRANVSPEWQHAQDMIRSGNHQQAQQLINQQVQRDPSLTGMMSTVSAMQRAQMPSPVVQELRQQTLQTAQTQIKQGPTQPMPYVVVAQYGLEDRNDQQFRQATQALVERFPNTEYANYYNGVRQLQDQDYKGAEASLRRARDLGMPEESVAELLRIAINNQRWVWEYATITLYIIAGWLLGLVLLFGIGKILSAFTLQAVNQGNAEVASPGDRFLRRAYRVIINLAGFYYYLSLPVVVLTALALPLALGYALLYVPVLNIGLAIVVLLGGIGGIITALSGVRAAFVRLPDDDIGKPVSPADAPQLWEIARTVAERVGTRCVDEIRVTPGTEVAVTERGGFLARLRDRGRRVLILGLGALQGMKLESLQCILAHEYGHFQNRDTAGGDVALRVNVAMFSFAEAIERRGKIRVWDVAVQFLRGYHYLYRRLTFGANRLQEVLADRVAVRCYGRPAFVEGLTHVIRRSVEFDVAMQREVRDAVRRTRPAMAFYTPPAPPELEEREQIETVVRDVLMRETDADDSHPSPKDRFALAARLDPSGRALDPGTAWELVAGNQRLLADMGAMLNDAITHEADEVEVVHGALLDILSEALRFQEHPDALHERAKIYLGRGQYDKAIEDYSKILKQSPRNNDVRFVRAMAYREQEQFDWAAEDLQHLAELAKTERLDRDDHYTLHANLAHCLKRMGRYPDALGYYGEALGANPKSLTALVERGQTHLVLGSNDEALADFSAAAAHWPNSPEPYLERARAYEALGQVEQAERDRSLARRLDPRNEASALAEDLPVAELLPDVLPAMPSLPATTLAEAVPATVALELPTAAPLPAPATPPAAIPLSPPGEFPPVDFPVVVRAPADLALNGVWCGTLSRCGLQLHRDGAGGVADLRAPVGTPAHFLDDNGLRITLSNQEIYLAVGKSWSQRQRLARDCVALLRGDKQQVRSADYALPRYLVLPSLLMLALILVPIWQVVGLEGVPGGVAWGVVCSLLAALCLVIVQKSSRQPHLRFALALAPVLFCWTAAVAALTTYHLLPASKESPALVKTPPPDVSVTGQQTTSPELVAGQPLPSATAPSATLVPPPPPVAVPAPPDGMDNVPTPRKRYVIPVESPVAFAWSPDSKHLVSAGKELAFWDSASGAARTTLADEGIHHLVYSPDGVWLATSQRVGQRPVTLRDGATGQVQRTNLFFKTKPAHDLFLAFSPDSRTLAAVTGSYILFLNLANFQQWQFAADDKAVFRGVQFGPDGKGLHTIAERLDVGSRRPLVVQTWNLPDGRQTQRRETSLTASAVPDAALSLDCRYLIGTDDAGGILWDLEKKELRRLPGKGAERILCTTVAPDRKTVLTGHHDGTLRAWEAATSKLLGAVKVHTRIEPVSEIRVSADGKLLGTRLRNSFKVFDWREAFSWPLEVTPLVVLTPAHMPMPVPPAGKPVPGLKQARALSLAQTRLTGMALAPDGRTVATSAPNHLSLWDSGGGGELAKLEDKSMYRRTLLFSPDGQWLFHSTGDRKAPIQMREAATGKIRAEFEHNTTLTFAPLEISPDSKTLASIGLNVVTLWKVPSGEKRELLRDNAHGFSGGRFSADGSKLRTIGTRHMANKAGLEVIAQLWDVDSGKLLDTRALTSGQTVHAPVLSPDGRFVAVIAPQTEVVVLDLNEADAKLAVSGKLKNTDRLAFSPDNRLLAAVREDGKLQLWDVARGEISAEVETTVTRSRLFPMAFSADAKTLAVAGNSSVLLFDVGTALVPKEVVAPQP